MTLTLEKLQIKNFRNIQEKIIDFSSGINCIFGDNGNGKTNLLEAIHFIINKKSFRKNTSFPQIISIDCEQPEIIISSLFNQNNSKITYTGKVDLKNSEYFLDNSPTKKKVGVETVFINPFDSYAFHNVPSFRRDWFDSHLGKIDKQYKQILNKYTQALRFRNSLLGKKPPQFENQVKAINPQLAEYSVFIQNRRKQFITNLSSYCEKTFKLIFEESHHLEIQIDSKFNNFTVQDFEQFYDNSMQKDIIIGKTQYGVHRDDYIFQFDGFNSYEFCSLGQQKMSFLSLIFAYIELFRYKFNSYPIVLIDDVSGELDGKRWKNLIGYLQAKKFQVMITTANEKFREELEKIEGSKKIFVDNGKVFN